jgi:hypothetical protein
MKHILKKYALTMILSSSLTLLSSSAFADPAVAKPTGTAQSAVTAEPTGTANTCSCPNPNAPLDKSNISDASLLVWANTAAVTAFSYNFVDYQNQLQIASAYFTPEGWKAFKDALNSSGNLATVIKNKLVVTAVARGAPVILQEGVLNGAYTWKVQMPLRVEYQSALGSNVQNSIVTMLIQRVKANAPNSGIGIKQFDVTKAPTTKASHEVTK